MAGESEAKSEQVQRLEERIAFLERQTELEARVAKLEGRREGMWNTVRRFMKR